MLSSRNIDTSTSASNRRRRSNLGGGSGAGIIRGKRRQSFFQRVRNRFRNNSGESTLGGVSASGSSLSSPTSTALEVQHESQVQSPVSVVCDISQNIFDPDSVECDGYEVKISNLSNQKTQQDDSRIDDDNQQQIFNTIDELPFLDAMMDIDELSIGSGLVLDDDVELVEEASESTPSSMEEREVVAPKSTRSLGAGTFFGFSSSDSIDRDGVTEEVEGVNVIEEQENGTDATPSVESPNENPEFTVHTSGADINGRVNSDETSFSPKTRSSNNNDQPAEGVSDNSTQDIILGTTMVKIEAGNGIGKYGTIVGYAGTTQYKVDIPGLGIKRKWKTKVTIVSNVNAHLAPEHDQNVEAESPKNEECSGTTQETTGSTARKPSINLEDPVEDNSNHRPSPENAEFAAATEPSTEKTLASSQGNRGEKGKPVDDATSKVPSSITKEDMGRVVRVIKGKKDEMGKLGELIKLRGTTQVVVKVDGNEKIKSRTSVCLVEDEETLEEFRQQENVCAEVTPPKRPTVVRKLKGTSTRSKQRTSAAPTNPFTAGIKRVTNLRSNTTKQSVPTNQLNSSNGDEWRVADHDQAGTRFGSRFIIKRRLAKDRKPKELTFLSHFLGNRFNIIEVALNKDETDKIDREVEEEGTNRRYKLVSTKVVADGDVNAGDYFKPKCVKAIYAEVFTPRLKPIDIEEELLKLGNFKLLPPNKTTARLELLQSPAATIQFYQNGSDIIKLIDDLGYVGSGFIKEEFLEEIMSTVEGMPQKACRDVVGIQVRIIVPKMGIFKGMLCRKRIDNGDAPIQLPLSMMKVPPSNHCDAVNGATLVVCKNGIHQRRGTANHYIGKYLDAKNEESPPKAFKEKIKKKLSEMVLRLWKELSVPTEVYEKYEKDSLQPKRRKHAWVVGLPDPTGLLPPGHIFVTGLRADSVGEEICNIFVTRSPCIKPDDGRIIPMVTSKPDGMSNDDWEWLNGLAFGAILFANPNLGMTPIPEQMANGDLDGDLYLICWDQEILSHIRAQPIRLNLPTEPETMPGDGRTEDEDWFVRAQEQMIDVENVQVMGRLTGTFYTLAKKVADSSPLYMGDPDAIAFAEAYNNALDFGKHRCRISLPEHLHQKLPKNLLKYVSIDGVDV